MKWPDSGTVQDRKTLRRVIKTSQNIAGTHLPSIGDVCRGAKRHHPSGNSLFTLLLSGNMYPPPPNLILRYTDTRETRDGSSWSDQFDWGSNQIRLNTDQDSRPADRHHSGSIIRKMGQTVTLQHSPSFRGMWSRGGSGVSVRWRGRRQ